MLLGRTTFEEPNDFPNLDESSVAAGLSDWSLRHRQVGAVDGSLSVCPAVVDDPIRDPWCRAAYRVLSRLRDRPENLSVAEHRRFTEIIRLAMTLGAMVVSHESEDVVGEILRFVRQEGVRVLIVGRPSRKGLLGRFTPGIVARLLAEADGIDLVVADVSRE